MDYYGLIWIINWIMLCITQEYRAFLYEMEDFCLAMFPSIHNEHEIARHVLCLLRKHCRLSVWRRCLSSFLSFSHLIVQALASLRSLLPLTLVVFENAPLALSPPVPSSLILPCGRLNFSEVSMLPVLAPPTLLMDGLFAWPNIRSLTKRNLSSWKEGKIRKIQN